MTDYPYYVLNKQDGIDTLHKNPRESCNSDQIEGRQTLDPDTGEALEKGGYVRLCQHCMKEDRP